MHQPINTSHDVNYPLLLKNLVAYWQYEFVFLSSTFKRKNRKSSKRSRANVHFVVVYMSIFNDSNDHILYTGYILINHSLVNESQFTSSTYSLLIVFDPIIFSLIISEEELVMKAATLEPQYSSLCSYYIVFVL